MEFFRHCPACGRRFLRPRTTITPFQAPSVLLVQEGGPILADIEEFQYTYKCNHCGHEWAEKHIEEHKES